MSSIYLDISSRRVSYFQLIYVARVSNRRCSIAHISLLLCKTEKKTRCCCFLVLDTKWSSRATHMCEKVGSVGTLRCPAIVVVAVYVTFRLNFKGPSMKNRRCY